MRACRHARQLEAVLHEHPASAFQLLHLRCPQQTVFCILSDCCVVTFAVHIALIVVPRCSSNREVTTEHTMADAAPVTANVQEEQPRQVRIGVLALQGSFREHIASLRRLPHVEAVEVRTKEQLRSVDGLIIPGMCRMHRPEPQCHTDMLCDAVLTAIARQCSAIIIRLMRVL